jgi:hypothetical protein
MMQSAGQRRLAYIAVSSYYRSVLIWGMKRRSGRAFWRTPIPRLVRTLRPQSSACIPTTLDWTLGGMLLRHRLATIEYTPLLVSDTIYTVVVGLLAGLLLGVAALVKPAAQVLVVAFFTAWLLKTSAMVRLALSRRLPSVRLTVDGPQSNRTWDLYTIGDRNCRPLLL